MTDRLVADTVLGGMRLHVALQRVQPISALEQPPRPGTVIAP